MALSVNYPLRVAPRPLAGTLPYGDRTFLPAVRRGGCPFGRPKLILAPRCGRLETLAGLNPKKRSAPKNHPPLMP